MSYLDATRLHFAGRFQANVSTVNNDPAHYDNATFKASYQKMEGPKMVPPNGWFNPQGDAAWRFLGCSVTSAWLPTGAVPTGDPVLGYLVADSDSHAPAKLVDLDPEQQLVSEIWGLQVRLATSDGTTVVQGDFQPVAFLDIWDRATDSSGGDTIAGAMYQSVLTNLEWGDVSGSPFLTALKNASGDRLSIKFNVDGFNMDFKSADFMTGRIAGTIGPWAAGEPDHLVMGRQFMAAAGANPSFFNPAGGLNFCCGVVDQKHSCLLLDLGNALSSSTPGGPLNDLGTLTVTAAGASGATTSLGTIPSQGSGGYAGSSWYPQTAGVVVLPLTAAQLQACKAAPLTITGNAGITISEWASGAFVRADRFVHRVTPGDTQLIDVIATQYGQPLAGAVITFTADSSQLQPTPDSFPFVGAGPPVSTPTDAVKFAAQATTDARGRAVIRLDTSDPGTPRYFNNGADYGIDGQVYGILPGFADAAYTGPANQWNFVSVLLWSQFRASIPVVWEELQPIFQQYANLYPVMNRFLDLGNYDSVVLHRELLQIAFGLDAHNPNAMPVTRDLSPAKRTAILGWLNAPIRRSATAAGQAVAAVAAAANAAAAPVPRAAAPDKPAPAAPPPRGGKASAVSRRLIVQQRQSASAQSAQPRQPTQPVAVSSSQATQPIPPVPQGDAP